MCGFSYNPNITIKFIEKNIDQINFHSLSENPNITIEFIERHKDKISFCSLSRNIFTFQKKLDRIRIKVFGLWILNKSPYLLGESLKRGIIQGYL